MVCRRDIPIYSHDPLVRLRGNFIESRLVKPPTLVHERNRGKFSTQTHVHQ